MSQINHVTAEGMAKLIADLDALRTERPVISAMIAEARDKGDLSENAEYDAAKEAQGLLEMRIAKLEMMVATSRILDPSKIDTKTVQIFNRVTLLNITNNKESTYQIVGETEANLREGKLSVTTPIAKAILGKKKGEKVMVTIPNGEIELQVLDISI